MTLPNWLKWSRQIQAIAQSGLAYSPNPFDKERYHHLMHIAAQMMAVHTQGDVGEVLQVFEQQSGYATPKVDVRGVLFREDRILLVRELMDGGRWTLPGGWVDVNEPPSLAVEREMREEAGIIVKAVKLLAVYDRNLHGRPYFPFHAYNFFFLCEASGHAPADPLETAEPTFFAETEIPELSTPRGTLSEIQRMFEHHRNPHLPTDFD